MEEKKADALNEPEVLLPDLSRKVIGRLTEVEALKMENISLRSEKLQLMKERLEGDIRTVEAVSVSLHADVVEMRKALAERLGVSDPTKILIRKTGEVEERQ